MVDGSVVLEVEGAGGNIQASLPPAAAASKAATAHCIIVSFCHMMAMVATTITFKDFIIFRLSSILTKASSIVLSPNLLVAQAEVREPNIDWIQ